jgi:SAM-dependent MidA family methyltransferase
VNDLERKIADRIAVRGPIPFSDFMRMALYDETHGYYRSDPFGKHGDFYTASQLHPVFGAYVSTLAAHVLPGFDHFIDIGAGRGELGLSFSSGVYRAVEIGQRIPQTNRSILFANELIDAMPVDLLGTDENFLRVTTDEDTFVWHPHAPLDGVIEVRRDTKPHLEDAFTSIVQGSYIIIDYGYRSRERARFPQGSLMSYRRHVASDDVLRDAGMRDITAHVDWDALIDEAIDVGWKVRSFENLRASVMSLGPDVLEGLNLLGEMQLKTLLFGMGESFDVLVLDKN